MNKIKNIFYVVLLATIMTSCSNTNEKYYCTDGVIRILSVKKYPCSRGGGDCSFQFYLYDGTKAYWCDTDEKTYSHYSIGDTLPTIVVTKTIKSK